MDDKWCSRAHFDAHGLFRFTLFASPHELHQLSWTASNYKLTNIETSIYSITNTLVSKLLVLVRFKFVLILELSLIHLLCVQFLIREQVHTSTQGRLNNNYNYILHKHMFSYITCTCIQILHTHVRTIYSRIHICYGYEYHPLYLLFFTSLIIPRVGKLKDRTWHLGFGSSWLVRFNFFF